MAEQAEQRRFLTDKELWAKLEKRGYDTVEYLPPPLLAVRLQRRLSQEAVGAPAGVTGAAIGQYELGVRTPSRTTQEKLAETLGLPVEYFRFDVTWKRPPAGRPVSRARPVQTVEALATDPVAVPADLLSDEELQPIIDALGYIPTPLERERRRRGWPVSELSRRSGVKNSTISNIEKGLSAALPTTMVKLAEAMDLPVRVLLPVLSDEEVQERLRQLGFTEESPAHLLCEMRTKWQLTVTELSELAPVDRKAIWAIESGHEVADQGVYDRLAEVFHLQPDDLRHGGRRRPKVTERPPKDPEVVKRPTLRVDSRQMPRGTPSTTPKPTSRPARKPTLRNTPNEAPPGTGTADDRSAGLGELREHANVPLAAVAVLSGIPVDVLAAVEAGEALPTVDMLRALAEVYGITAEDLWPCPAGNRLKVRRELAGLSRKQLADRTGADESLIWWLEAERISLQPWMLVPLSTVLKVYPDDLRAEAERSPLAAVLMRTGKSSGYLAAHDGLTAADVRHLQAQWNYPRPGVLRLVSGILGVDTKEVWRGPEKSPFRTAREIAGFTTGQVAERAGLPESLVKDLETQWRLPSSAVLRRMLSAVRVPGSAFNEVRRMLVPELAGPDGHAVWVYEDDTVIAVVPWMQNGNTVQRSADRAQLDPTHRPRHAGRMSAPLMGFETAFAVGSRQARYRGAPKVFPSDAASADIRSPKRTHPVHMVKLNRWFKEIREAAAAAQEIGTFEYTEAEAEKVPGRVGLRSGWYQTQVELARRELQGLDLGRREELPWTPTPIARPSLRTEVKRPAPAVKKAQPRPKQEPLPVEANKGAPKPTTAVAEKAQGPAKRARPAKKAQPPAPPEQPPAEPDPPADEQLSEHDIRELLSEMGLGEPDQLNPLMVERYRQELSVAAVAERAGVPEGAVHALEPLPLDPTDPATIRVAWALGMAPAPLGMDPLRYHATSLVRDERARVRAAASLSATSAHVARRRSVWKRRLPEDRVPAGEAQPPPPPRVSAAPASAASEEPRPAIMQGPVTLTALRQEAGLTTDELARRSGLSERAIDGMETEGRIPGRGAMHKLADALGMPVQRVWSAFHRVPGPDVLTEALRQWGWSSRELSKRSGVALSVIRGFANGSRIPERSTVERLAVPLGMKPEELWTAPHPVEALREQRGWTRQDLADDSGLSVDTVFHLETWQAIPHPNTVLRVARSLGIPTEELARVVHPAYVPPTGLAALRIERGLMAEELAKAARVGKRSLGDMEAGRRVPIAANLLAVARVLEVEPVVVWQAMGFEGEPDALRMLRGRWRMSVETLARRARVRKDTPRRLDRGLMVPHPELVQRVASVLRADPDELMRALLAVRARRVLEELTSVATLREQRGLTKTQLADRAGLSRSAVRDFENRATVPRPQTVRQLAEALEVATEVIWHGLVPDPSPAANAEQSFRYWDADVVADIPGLPVAPQRHMAAEWTDELENAARQTPQAAYLLGSMVGFAAGYKDGCREAMARGAPRAHPVPAATPRTARGRRLNALPVPLPKPPEEVAALDAADAVLRGIAFGTLEGELPPWAPRTVDELVVATEDLARRRGRSAGWNLTQIHEARRRIVGRDKAGTLEMSVAGPVA